MKPVLEQAKHIENKKTSAFNLYRKCYKIHKATLIQELNKGGEEELAKIVLKL